MLHYHDEPDLQRKIIAILNSSGYHFERTAQDFDAVDPIEQAYLEVKQNEFAPAQLLYAVARTGVSARYVLLADASELRVYACPSHNDLANFANGIDPTLKTAPSAVNSIEHTNEAMKLLGEHLCIFDYHGDFSLDKRDAHLFITKDNVEIVKTVLDKYEIKIEPFIHYLANLLTKNQEIDINNEGQIFNKNTFDPFKNPSIGGQQSFTNEFRYKPINNVYDKQLIINLRINSGDVKGIIRELGSHETIQQRRQGGRFFTKDTIAKTVTDIVDELHPEFIVEPYVGAGSLIENLVEKYPGAANDIKTDDIAVLKDKYEGLPWTFTNLDMFTTPTDELIEKMGIPRDKMVAFVTNPPWGTSMTNRLVSKHNEVVRGSGRRVDINYGGLDKIYGRGNIIIPAVSRMIEMIKIIKNGFLIMFSPLGIFCGRKQYNKLFKAILKNFTFLEGYIISGDNFEGTSEKIPVALTIWKYILNKNTTIDDLSLLLNETIIKFKRSEFLKDTIKHIVIDGKQSELGAIWSTEFNKPGFKSIYFGLHRGGVQMIPDIIKIDANILNIPSELVYTLWAICVGTSALIQHELQFEQAYVHLPDFNRQETMEILAYTTLHTIIYESISSKKYCEGQIGFVGMSRVFKFGNDRLTAGAKYLVETYGDCQVGDSTIRDVFNHVKETPNETDEYHLLIRKQIREQIKSRLDAIGYWDYIPIPRDF